MHYTYDDDLTSPELKRPLVQLAVVHKIHKHTREKGSNNPSRASQYNMDVFAFGPG